MSWSSPNEDHNLHFFNFNYWFVKPNPVTWLCHKPRAWQNPNNIQQLIKGMLNVRWQAQVHWHLVPVSKLVSIYNGCKSYKRKYNKTWRQMCSMKTDLILTTICPKGMLSVLSLCYQSHFICIKRHYLLKYTFISDEIINSTIKFVIMQKFIIFRPKKIKQINGLKGSACFLYFLTVDYNLEVINLTCWKSPIKQPP